MLKQLMMYPMVQRTKSSYKSAKSSKHPYLIGIAAFIATSIAANWCTAEERSTSFLDTFIPQLFENQQHNNRYIKENSKSKSNNMGQTQYSGK